MFMGRTFVFRWACTCKHMKVRGQPQALFLKCYWPSFWESVLLCCSPSRLGWLVVPSLARIPSTHYRTQLIHSHLSPYFMAFIDFYQLRHQPRFQAPFLKNEILLLLIICLYADMRMFVQVHTEIRCIRSPWNWAYEWLSTARCGGWESSSGLCKGRTHS